MKLIKKIFYYFWEETTVKVGNSAFEMGGFIISLGITIFILWSLGLLDK
jgi:hypothetical protein